jgi:hypothetical protein
MHSEHKTDGNVSYDLELIYTEVQVSGTLLTFLTFEKYHSNLDNSA